MKNHNIMLTSVLLALAWSVISPLAMARPTPTPTPTATPPLGEDRGNNNSAAENVDALNISTTGQYNTAHGWHALSANATGTDNTANGTYALFSNTTGWRNTAVGAWSLQANTTGGANVAVGDAALFRNTTGSSNVAVGDLTLVDNTTGWSNTAVGGDALSANTTGLENTAMGGAALESNTTGSGNVAVGAGALSYRTGASYNLQGANTAVGYYASDGIGNTAIGNRAGFGLLRGTGNVYIGEQEMARDPNESYHTYIHNINTTSVSGGSADTVTIDLTTGLLGHLTSSRRHKEDIKAMDNASETLYLLKPVTYRYKKEIDRDQALDYGLIAEEVAEIDPTLALRNAKGEIESVRYNAINVMLLNEFLKEHKAFVEEQGKVTKLEAGLAGLLATVKEQAAQIEKVSAQVQMRQPRMSVARINP